MISVVVPVKDRRERMLRCLDALLAQDHDDYEVLVLDNGSSDGTADAVRTRARGARVPVRVEVVSGSVGHVRNRGAQLAAGEIVAYTDSDCIPEPGWLRAGASPFVDAGVGVVTGRTLPEVPADRPWPATIEVTGPTGLFESCNVLFRREAVTQTTGFDEELGHLWEDAAAGWAALRAGWRAVYAEDAVVRHDVTYPGLGWWLRRAQRYGNVAKVARDYPEIRSELLWARWFLRPRSAAMAGAALGVALAPLDRRALALVIPYALMRAPRRATPGAARAAAEGALFDAAIFVGTLRGSVRHRSLVL